VYNSFVVFPEAKMNIYFQFLQATVALFIITDPLGNLPIFMGLTEGMDKKARRNTFAEALYVGFFLLMLFTLAGSGILSLFMINLYDFKIAGGLLLLVMSFFILIRGHIMEIHPGEDPGAVPLGCPLLVGPGAITTAMVLIGMYGMGITIAAVAINFLISGLILFYGDKIYETMGKTGGIIVAKVMAIVLAAIAVKFIREGVVALLRLVA
jgi:multiple antibiotic resistance protein